MDIKQGIYILINNLIWLPMNQESSDSSIIDGLINQSGEQANGKSESSSSQPRQEVEGKGPRRPGRPPLRIKNRLKLASKNSDPDNQKDEDFEGEWPKCKERNQSGRQEKQNNLEGFIKIIDYLKRIQCDETSLHNKMNPYNLLTPTCFWYMISAEYFSFDFFSSRNAQEVALELLRKAQKTQIVLPLRFIKPQRAGGELEFESEQLRLQSSPITERLTALSGLISTPLQTYPEQVEKSGFITSIVEDNHFRSSTRAMIFNWIKKRMASSEKWNSAVKPKPESGLKIPPKQFACPLYEREEEVKHQQLDVAPQIYYRQRRVHKNQNELKKTKTIRRGSAKQKKVSKKAIEDQIYDESQSQQIKKEEEEPGPVQKVDQIKKEEKLEQEVVKQKGDQMQPEGEMKMEGEESGDEQEGAKNKSYEIVNIVKNYDDDDVLLDAILHMPLDNIISILKSSIETPKLPYLTRPFMPPVKSDPLELVYQMHPDEQVFLNYMKQRQEKMYIEKTSHCESLIEQKQREGQVEDAKCQVCTDGDYTEDNLIVFCSMCNISLHQRCVGLAKVPADNWVCEVCASFGPAGINVPCPLCHVKGGALKRTSIHINTPLFKDTNPEYHEYAKRCPNYKHKQEYTHPREGAKGEEESYYDYFSKTTYPTEEPVCHFVWVHYVCAIWIPECYFEQKNGLINIKGIQNIDKKRFREKCLVCKEVKAGACAKCDNENCSKYYHPQCARKKKIYMEQLNLDKLKYLIFCEAHQPLKVKRKIEVKKKKQRDQIVKFCRGIEKYVQTYKIANLPFKLSKLGANNGSQANRVDLRKQKQQQGEQKIMIKLQKNNDEDFIKSVIEGLVKQNQIIVNLACLGGERYKIEEVIKPSKRDMRKSLTRLDQFWKHFKNAETPEANLKRFNNIMRENNYLKEKIENFINFGSNAEQTPGKEDKRGGRRGFGGRKKRERVQTVVEQQGALFCVCRRPYNGENDMFECEVCNEWYHHECIGFIGSEEDAQKLVFHCMKCLKYESPDAKKQLLDKCSQLFSQDSLYLNYRPPTPSLQSEDESAKVNAFPVEQVPKANPQIKQPFQQVRQVKPRMKSESTKYMIPDTKINLELPFIVYDPMAMDDKPIQQKPQRSVEEQESPHFGEDNSQQHPQQKLNNTKKKQQDMEDQNILQNGQHVGKQMQANQAELSPHRQLGAQQVMNRTHSSQSSQLHTPQFRPSIYSFANAQEQCIQKLPSISSQQPQHQGSAMEDESQNSKPNAQFHFNRSQIEKLKNQIQQQEVQGGQVHDNGSGSG